MTRGPAWRQMQIQHGRPHRNLTLLIILSQPAQWFLSLSTEPPPVMLSHLSWMPCQCMPLLCCIVTEQFGTAPPVVPRYRPAAGVSASTFAMGFTSYADVPLPIRLYSFLSVLVESVANLLKQHPTNGEQLSFLTAPIVLQLLKVIVILPANLLPSQSDFVPGTDCVWPTYFIAALRNVREIRLTQ